MEKQKNGKHFLETLILKLTLTWSSAKTVSLGIGLLGLIPVLPPTNCVTLGMLPILAQFHSLPL